MKRIKNIFTTLIGTLLILTCLYFVYKGKTTFTEAAGFITIGVALLFSNDEAFAANFLPFIKKQKEQQAPSQNLDSQSTKNERLS